MIVLYFCDIDCNFSSSFLILFIWVLSIFLMSLAKVLLILLFFPKIHLFVSLIFFILFSWSLFSLLPLCDLYYLLSSAHFWLCFSFHKWSFRFFILDFSCFLKYACVPIGLSLRTALLHPIDFGKFCFYFHVSQDIFRYPIYFFHWLLKFLVVCCLVFLHLCFPQFSSCNWLLVSYCCGQKRCLM